MQLWRVQQRIGLQKDQTNSTDSNVFHKTLKAAYYRIHNATPTIVMGFMWSEHRGGNKKAPLWADTVTSKRGDCRQSLDVSHRCRMLKAGKSLYLCRNGEANYSHSVAAVDSTWSPPFICKKTISEGNNQPWTSLWAHQAGAIVEIGMKKGDLGEGFVLLNFSSVTPLPIYCVAGLQTLKPVSHFNVYAKGPDRVHVASFTF